MSKIPAATEIVLSPRPQGLTISRWLYDEIRRAILDGRLPRGTRIPGTRDFAVQQGISRRTVVTVFEQLQAEGYLTGRVGSGTVINETLPDDLLQVRASHRTPNAASKPEIVPYFGHPARPFRPNQVALDAFPMELWARIGSRRMRRISSSLLAGGNLAGYPPLRQAIAAYLGTSRGVNCTADQIVITSGIQQGLDLAARLLLKRGDRIWIEDPAYPGASEAFRTAGVRLVPVRVDERGLDPKIGRSVCPIARAAYVTPANQFPLGATMSLERRLALLSWARETGAWIIEDDYDSEFRFTQRPLAALQGLDTSETVVFAGSFNKVLFPSLRLGYLVLPSALVDPMLALRYRTDRYPAALPQAVLCDFMVEGHFGRHLRRMRELYASRSEALREGARRYLGGLLELPITQSGLNTPAFLKNGIAPRQAEALLAEHGIECRALDRFALRRRDLDGLLLGFGAFDEREIHRCVLILAKVLAKSRPAFGDTGL